MFERLSLGICTDDKWNELDEDTQVLLVAYEKIRESEEASEISSLIQASAMAGIKRIR